MDKEFLKGLLVLLFGAIIIVAIIYLFYLLATDFTSFILTLIGFIIGIPLLILIITYIIENPIWYKLIIPLCTIAIIAIIDEAKAIPDAEYLFYLKYILFILWPLFGIKSLLPKEK